MSPDCSALSPRTNSSAAREPGRDGIATIGCVGRSASEGAKLSPGTGRSSNVAVFVGREAGGIGAVVVAVDGGTGGFCSTAVSEGAGMDRSIVVTAGAGCSDVVLVTSGWEADRSRCDVRVAG